MRNCSPSVAEICSLDSSRIGNGSEPNFRTVTSLLASFGREAAQAAGRDLDLAVRDRALDDGAEMTAPSRVIAKYWPMCSAVYLANS